MKALLILSILLSFGISKAEDYVCEPAEKEDQVKVEVIQFEESATEGEEAKKEFQRHMDFGYHPTLSGGDKFDRGVVISISQPLSTKKNRYISPQEGTTDLEIIVTAELKRYCSIIDRDQETAKCMTICDKTINAIDASYKQTPQ